ncbi:outer membrane protein [Helicobacter pylori]|uniref:Hop family adhesin AlpB n=1 Tax=Helicobacter pylori TaxID=210 RepID=UPI00112C2634|nr:Hop family adhesin AlpB [Helicobacter pylori]TPH38412.1 outer membrane protein [Helicobacter pylori]
MKQNLKPFKMIKENLMTQSQKVRFLAPLSLALSLSFNQVGAEEDGGFMTFGYELGQVVQQVKNPGKIKAEELAGLLNSTTTNNTNINIAGTGGNVAGTLGNLFMNQLGNLIDLYPTLNTSSIHQCGATNNGSSSGATAATTNNSPCFQGNLSLYDEMVSSVKTLSQDLKNNIFQGNNNTTSANLSNQLSELNTASVYLTYMNSFLNANNQADGIFQNNTNQAYRNGVTAQQIAYILKQASVTMGPSGNGGAAGAFLDAALAQHVFNSANAGNDLSAKEFTSLVQNIVDTSQNALTLANNANISNSTGYQVSYGGNIDQARSTQLLNNTTNTLAKVTALNNELKANPWLGNFAAGNSSQVNAFNGFITKIGYKQFFGENKNVGLRYYGFFSYNGAGVGNGPTYNQVNLLTYGVGTDVLYNVFSRSFGSRSLNAGFFGGIQLAGDTYISTLRNSPQLANRPTATKFQFLFDVGLRMNFGILKKDLKSHNQHSIEIGVQIPTIYNTYYKAGGTEVKYFRPYSVYWVYGYAF